jgi:hypothetical protein
LHRGANVTAHDPAFFAQTLHHIAGKVRGNREADTLISTASAEDGSVNAQQLALNIDQRAAGIAHVNCRIGSG